VERRWRGALWAVLGHCCELQALHQRSHFTLLQLEVMAVVLQLQERLCCHKANWDSDVSVLSWLRGRPARRPLNQRAAEY
jgi:hypothetical protein